VFLRILLWSVLIFFLARFVWKILVTIFGQTDRGRPKENVPEPPEKSREKFDDVRDAKFIDVPKTSEPDSGDQAKQE